MANVLIHMTNVMVILLKFEYSLVDPVQIYRIINSFSGIVHCRDGSDETTENCIATSCPSYGFRCAYGACVAGNAECNRKIEVFQQISNNCCSLPTEYGLFFSFFLLSVVMDLTRTHQSVQSKVRINCTVIVLERNFNVTTVIA